MVDGPEQIGHDIFLDFMNRDTRQIFGVYDQIPSARHVELLEQALNLCVFTTRDACIMPPGFLAEDPLVRRALKNKSGYRDDKLIRLPIRETLDEFWAKKAREYEDIRTAYEGLYDRDGQRFVSQNQHLLIDRPFEVGSALVDGWEEAPDTPGYWHDTLSQFPPSVVELFRRVPRQLAADGKAITWASISGRIAEVAKRYPRYRRLVQHIYFGIYMRAYDLRIIRGLPLIRDSFGLSSGPMFYDADAIQTIVRPTGLWEALLAMPADAMARLRRAPAYFEYRRLAWQISSTCKSLYSLRAAMAIPHAQLDKVKRWTADADEPSASVLALFPLYTDVAVEAFAERLRETARLGLSRALDLGATKDRGAREGRLVTESSPVRVRPLDGQTLAVYVALREERQHVARALELKPVSGSDYVWEGELPGGTRLLLYSSNRMGRVPAAVATAKFLASNTRLAGLLVLGIAGGFEEAHVGLGDILVPDTVADLASRKVTSDDAADSLVRPKPYELSQTLIRYLEVDFDRTAWVNGVVERLPWPEDRRPRFGPKGPGGVLASVDEVVASNSHRAALIEAWPELLGVEMEAGGVLAAAREFDLRLPVMQVRVVSDMADPAKSDSQWRSLGMQTLADLCKAVDWHSVIAPA